MPEKTKRTWVYIQKPSDYEISGCTCGNNDPQWSEFVGHLWCEPCQKDFIPTRNGVFDGPIPSEAAAILGMSFDRINLETNQVEHYDRSAGKYVPTIPKI